MQREYSRRGAVKGQLGSRARSSDTDIDLPSSHMLYAIVIYVEGYAVYLIIEGQYLS